VIPGTSNPKHMEDIITAGEGELPDDELCKKMADFVSRL
jgi:aryl-alcohol dehydrogenase-like predicted oxidoreductase